MEKVCGLCLPANQHDLLHGDVKLGNVLVGQDGRAKVCGPEAESHRARREARARVELLFFSLLLLFSCLCPRIGLPVVPKTD